MPTNVIEAGRGLTYGNGWQTAGQAIDSGLQSVLGVYQDYQKQKRFEQQQQWEHQYKAQQMAAMLEEQKSKQEERNDKENQRLSANTAAKAQMMDPNTPIDQMPTDWVNTKTINTPVMDNSPAPEALAGPPVENRQVGTTQQTQKTLKPFIDVGGYTTPLDIGGVRARTAAEAAKQDGWATIPQDMDVGSFHFKAGEKVSPATTALLGLLDKPGQKPQFEHGANGALYRVGADGSLSLAAAGKEPAMSASDKKAAKDQQTNDMIDSIQPGDPNSIPQQYRDMVVAFAEGRGVTPRAGTNLNLLQQMAWRFNPGLDMTKVNARKALRADMVKGSQTTRGGQLSSLSTLADHLTKLQESSDALGEHIYGGTPSSLVNAGLQAVIPRGWKTDAAAYNDKAISVVDEYIRALKGASPTESEQREFTAIKNPSTPPSERNVHIQALMDMAAGRANSHEDAFNSAFGKSSSDSGSPILSSRNWVWDGSTWHIKRKGEKVASPGAARPAAVVDPYGVRGAQ